VRVPQHERDAERADERSRDDGVERDHVRNDADRPRPELARERRLEPRAALHLGGCAELVHARVLRHRACDRGVAEHDELVDALRERAHHRHRRGEHRIIRVELLRGEDQAFQVSDTAVHAALKRNRGPRG
jgi:hypothetical protein